MHQSSRSGVRNIFGRHQVATADVDRVEPERSGGIVEQPFHHEYRRGSRDAPVRAGRRGVGGHAEHLAAIVGELVGAGQQATGHERLDARCPRRRAVRPDIRVQHSINGHQRAVGLEAGSNPVVMVTRLQRRDHVLGPSLDPSHRSTHAAGQLAHSSILGIQRSLGAEAAADIADVQAHCALGQAQRGREAAAVQVRHLRD